MKREDKNNIIDSVKDTLNNNEYLYLADISNLNSESTSKLRRLCFKREVTMMVIKNTLLRKAMEHSDKDFEPLYDILKGNTALMYASAGNIPARMIKEFRKESDRPILKGAYVEEMTFKGDDQLEVLANIKSKNELIGDIILMLQSPAKNVISALQSGGQKITGVLKTLSEREG